MINDLSFSHKAQQEIKKLIDSNSTLNKETLVSSLRNISSKNLLTHEKEIIGDIYTRISSIVSVDISEELDKWAYGNLIVKLLNLKRKFSLAEKILFTCIQCRKNIGIEITEKSPNIPSCLLYTSPSPRDLSTSRMPSSA